MSEPNHSTEEQLDRVFDAFRDGLGTASGMACHGRPGR